MADTKPARTVVTLIQDPNGISRRVRIDGTEISVLNCAPIAGVGMMNFSMTLADVEIAYEAAEPAKD